MASGASCYIPYNGPESSTKIGKIESETSNTTFALERAGRPMQDLHRALPQDQSIDEDILLQMDHLRNAMIMKPLDGLWIVIDDNCILCRGILNQ